MPGTSLSRRWSTVRRTRSQAGERFPRILRSFVFVSAFSSTIPPFCPRSIYHMIKNSEHAYIEWKSKLELVMKEQYNITKQCDYAFGVFRFQPWKWIQIYPSPPTTKISFCSKGRFFLWKGGVSVPKGDETFPQMKLWLWISRFPCSVLLTLSWNTKDENPSIDKLNRAIN